MTRERVSTAERDARIDAMLRRGREAAARSYDPVRHLLGGPAGWAAGKTVYRPPMSLWYAHALLREGGSENERTATAIVGVALDSQERSPGHPHRGNFLWLADDEEVVDLNAVQFMLRALLPLLAEHGSRLPASLLERCRDAVRLALDEQERMDVAPTYTNIHLMALFSLVVGGEWLTARGDEAGDRYLALGRRRWAEWVRFTTGSGAPHEFNSPGYGAIDLSALAALHRYARDPLVSLQADLLYERLWLHLALHLHPPTGQQAGPHCRCYWRMMTGEPPAVLDLLWREAGRTFVAGDGDGGDAAARIPESLELALTDHRLPEAVRTWLEHHAGALPCEVRETADREEGQTLTTYLTPSYALGTAAHTYSIGQDDYYIEHQANYLALHYRRPPSSADSGAWGLVYSRYVVNDRHLGTLSAAPDRPKTMNFYDQGNFAGAQRHNKAIALYALQPQPEEVFSLKTVVVFPRAETLEEVWLGDRRVSVADLPVPVPDGEWVVVADGELYAGVRPLAPSRLGRLDVGAPVLLERGPAGELWLTAYNYRGPAKRFWDYASLRGAFWRGNLRAGYVLEAAGRHEYASAAAFLAYLRAADVRDETAPAAESPLVRTVAYASGGDEIELRYDLWRTRTLGRRINGVADAAPALDSPLAVQDDSGTLRAGSAVLHTDPGDMVWLIAQEHDPARRVWTVVNPQDRPTGLRLETGAGVVATARMGAGRVQLRALAGAAPELVLETPGGAPAFDLPPGTRLRTGPATA
jgi:hypothetical protein